MEPDLPNVNLMLTYIQVFCDNLNVYFPFIAYDETLKQFFGKTLTPLMANCIAALAVKFVELPDVLTRGVMYVTDQYIDKAKVMWRMTRFWSACADSAILSSRPYLSQ